MSEFDLEKEAEAHARKRYWDVKSVGQDRIEADVTAGIVDYQIIEKNDLKAIISKLRGER